jgi:glycosyltransferase involved in cell wall biosynthesis
MCSTGLYGAERWVLALMRCVEKGRVRSTLVNLVDHEDAESEVVRAARARGLAASDLCTGGRFNPLSVPKLVRLAKKNCVDIIHGHGYKSDILGLLVAKLSGLRVMTTPHGWSVDRDRKLQLYEKIDRHIFRFMDIVCPLSDKIYQDAICYTRHNLHLIGNGVDIDEVRSVEATETPKARPFLVGYVGRLEKGKDVATLLYAAHLLSLVGRTVHVLIVGEGQEQERLYAKTLSLGLQEIIKFTGFQVNPISSLKQCDCFVLPSLSEGTPRCIMEAMVLKIPVIASDIPGNRLLVTHQKTGLLFPVGDSRKLADSIMYIMDNPDRANELALAGCRKVECEFSSNRMATEYTLLYESLVSTVRRVCRRSSATENDRNGAGYCKK